MRSLTLTDSSWLTQIHLRSLKRIGSRSLKQIRWSLQTLIDSSLLMQTGLSWLRRIDLSLLKLIRWSLQRRIG